LSESLLALVADNFSKVIRNALEHSKMKDLAMRDDLTRLFNRRIFDETLDHRLRNTDACPISLLLMDLDNFKKVNDTFGHQAGDRVLNTFAKILKESCRGNDLVARIGGEEFAIILSQTGADDAFAIAQRIRKKFAETVFPFDDRQIQLTTSAGLATTRKGSTTFAPNLVKRADFALYQAKKTGKNKVCIFTADLLSQAPDYPVVEDHDSRAFAFC
jgi:diguanylate cyclase (GGDEF)-like protein